MVSHKYSNVGLRDQRAALECELADTHLFFLKKTPH